jgi:hypothetical protein
MAERPASFGPGPCAKQSRRQRNRAEEPWYKSRRQSATRRAYPQFVDAGAVEHPVRYDEELDGYDLRDALKAAFGNESAVKVSSKELGVNFGLQNAQFSRVKWSDGDTNAGAGRILCDAKTCGAVIRASIKHHSRSSLFADSVALWFEEQANCSTQPTLLLATVSAHGVANQHAGL